MTIQDAIVMIDNLKPNAYTEADKIGWLDRLDRTVMEEVIMTHEGYEEYDDFDGYDADTDRTTVLLAGPPHDEIYLRYLEAQIDYADGELERYQNSFTMFNSAYRDFQNAYNRAHKPRGNELNFF